MKNLRTTAMFAAFSILTAGAAICSAQPGRAVGGFRDTGKTDETVVAAANFAVQTQAQQDATLELVRIQRAERQIVAGSNYRLCLDVKSKKKPEQATATVYLNLQNEFSLSDWTAGKCGDSKAIQSIKLNDVEPPETETSGRAANATTTVTTATKTALVSGITLVPDEVVKSLYAEQKNPKTAPFFQFTNRAAVDKYFKNDFADLIWNDAVKAKGEVGAIEFDPLFGAQDPRVTAFKIGKPEYADETATVSVTFKNAGKADAVKFIFERENKVWKVADIRYRNGDVLKGILFAAQPEIEKAQP